MNYLILGGTGTVGSDVVRGLLKQGKSIRVLTRSEEKSRSLPKGAEGVVGDLTDPSSYDRIFSGSDHLFLLNALGTSELQEGLSALNEAKKHGYKKIVYMTVHDVEVGVHIPHFASKIVIQDAVKDSRIPYTLIKPNNFYQNDFWFKDVILQNSVYPQPIGDVGISRVDTRDVAEACVNALVNDSFSNKSFALVGPEALTGEACARIYSNVLGKQVTYAGNDLDAWYQEAIKGIPAWLAYDFAIMYKMFQDDGLKATPAQLKETETILGRAPRRYEDFAREFTGKTTTASANR